MDYELGSYSDRFIASIIDSILFFIVPMLIVYPFMEHLSFETMDNISLIILLIYLLKDLFGRSPGKYLFGLRIINKTGIGKVNPLKLFFRNISLPFGIIDVIVLLVNRNRQRIGELIVSTIVVRDISRQKELPQKEEYKGNTKERIECVNCGNILVETEEICNKCGWTYK